MILSVQLVECMVKETLTEIKVRFILANNLITKDLNLLIQMNYNRHGCKWYISAKPCTYPIKVKSIVQAIICIQKIGRLGRISKFLDLDIQITLSFITRPPQLTNGVSSKLKKKKEFTTKLVNTNNTCFIFQFNLRIFCFISWVEFIYMRLYFFDYVNIQMSLKQNVS